MPAVLLRQDALNETFADTERLIYHTIHAFIKQYGGSFDDLLEHSGLAFMRAYDGYDRRRSKFSARLRYILWHEFLELRRQRAKRNGIVVYKDLDPDAYEARKVFDRFLFLDSLSEDARIVVSAVFDTPWQFEPEPNTIRFVIREYLQGLGWSQRQIAESFREIRLALGGL